MTSSVPMVGDLWDWRQNINLRRSIDETEEAMDDHKLSHGIVRISMREGDGAGGFNRGVRDHVTCLCGPLF